MFLLVSLPHVSAMASMETCSLPVSPSKEGRVLFVPNLLLSIVEWTRAPTRLQTGLLDMDETTSPTHVFPERGRSVF